MHTSGADLYRYLSLSWGPRSVALQRACVRACDRDAGRASVCVLPSGGGATKEVPWKYSERSFSSVVGCSASDSFVNPAMSLKKIVSSDSCTASVAFSPRRRFILYVRTYAVHTRQRQRRIGQRR
eukprot:GHVU01080882.1.p3 GENE.GHVU01080882.1~~GHVU01080882.1.p3  ORF type:complete len:125 (+),score=8.89 GHVU01080882.1:880-1254(+)